MRCPTVNLCDFSKKTMLQKATLSRFTLAVFVFTILYTSRLAAQNGGTVIGIIVDSTSSRPLAYATVAIYKEPGRTLAGGAITDDNGKFTANVPFGTHSAEVSFIGFGTKQIPVFKLDEGHPSHDLGTLLLAPNSDLLNEVEVRGEKSSMELSLDRKIFNVGQDLANSGGNATDVLMNIPSVAVDPEGNVRLRGSDNVRILIDGKPSGLVSFKGGSGLQQLQASMIERVEVITNPSARYEAEGLGGIINIVLKKEKNSGFNGSFDVITGYPDNHGLAANVNYRHRKVNFFVNYGIAYRDQPGRGSLYQEVYTPDETFLLKQTNRSYVRGLNNNIRGGIDLYFTETSILTGSYLYRRSDAKRITDIVYRDYAGSPDNLLSYTTRRQDEDEIEPNSEYSLIYKRVMPGNDHQFLAEVKYLDNWESSDQTFTQFHFNPDGTPDHSKDLVQKSLNDESEKQLLFQADYTRPLPGDGRFETGIRSSFRDMTNDFLVTEQNNEGEFIPLENLDNIFFYDENIIAAYAILGNKTGIVSYQAGLRGEWTDVKTTLAETGEVNPRKYYNLFPSVHVTFNLPKQNDLQLSYSRRIRRPYYNDLSPFVTFSDERNFFSGNPDLNPEYSHVIDIGYARYFDMGSITASVYTRLTTDKIESIRLVDLEGFSNTRTENLNSEEAYGVELTGTIDLTSWWKLDANLNFFYADVDGTNIVSTYANTTYSWFARQTSRIALPAKVDLQIRTNYEAPQKTVQGRRKSLFYTDISLSKDILKGNGTINLTTLDLFNSRRFRSTAEGATFFSDRDSQYRRRQINLTFSYRIRQTKGQRQKRDIVPTE